MTVIARPPIAVEGMLDRAIQRKALDSPVKPENDKQTKLCRHTNDRINNTYLNPPPSALRRIRRGEKLREINPS